MEHQQLSAGDGAPSVSGSQTGTSKAQGEAFGDTLAFVVPHEQPMPGYPLDALFTTQSEGGPTFIRVGTACTDAQLREAWERRTRFATLTLDQLLEARDARVTRSRVLSELQWLESLNA